GEFLSGKEPLPGWIDPAHHSTLKSRAASTFSNPNMLGTYLALSLPCSLALVMEARTPELVAAASVASLLVFGGLALTFSRGAWLAGLAGILAFAWLMRRHHLRGRLAIVAGACVLVALLAARPLIERASTFGSGGELGIHQRVELYHGV